jgi:hypothetical protein
MWHNFCPSWETAHFKHNKMSIPGTNYTTIFSTAMFARSADLIFDLLFLKLYVFLFNIMFLYTCNCCLKNMPAGYQVGAAMELGFVKHFTAKRVTSPVLIRQLKVTCFFWILCIYEFRLTPPPTRTHAQRVREREKYCNSCSKIPSCTEASKKLSVQYCKHSKVMRH